MMRSNKIYGLLFFVALMVIYAGMYFATYRTLNLKRLDYLRLENKGSLTKVIKDRSTKQIEREQSTIKQRIEIKCEEFGYKPKNILDNKEKFWIDVRHNLLFCMNPKVGSSTWRRHFYYLLTIKERKALESKYGADCWKHGGM